MELYSAEAKAIDAQIGEWMKHSEYELETTFGSDGRVDATTFINVSKRLAAKGYRSLPQEDRLTITTKEHIRFTMSSLGIIQQYCRDDTLAGKPFTAMIKDRSVATSNIDLDEYGVRIKTRREVEMASDDAEVKKLIEQWPRVAKAFRMIRRWTFEGDGIRIDMSIVRSTKHDPRGEYRWQRNFRDQDIMKSRPFYEIEVELLHMEGDTVEAARKRLIKGVGEILRGIQKNSILVRTSTKQKVLGAYKLLTGSERFRGPNLRTLQKVNFSAEKEVGEANIRDGYNVTDKADGLRCVGFCDSRGELFLIDMAMNVYRTGLQQPQCRESLVDGEWVTLSAPEVTGTRKALNQFLLFDIFFAPDKKNVSTLPFQPPSVEQELEGRYGQLKKWATLWNSGEGAKVLVPGVTPQTRLQVSMKSYIFAKAGDTSIFRAAGRVLDTARVYYTDGLIFTPNLKPLPTESGGTFMEQFKWKPPRDNTIDFLVKFEKSGDSVADKITTGVNPDSGETVSYKTLRLFVGSTTENAHNVVLNMQDLPREDQMRGGKDGYKPVLFAPKDFPDTDANRCNLPIHEDPDTGESYVQTHETEEPIQDSTIVEMAYDPKQPPGWRWNPIRVRMDKTERLQRGELGRTLNSAKVANDVWNSIYDPISVSMIRTGGDEPSEEEQAELNRIGGSKTSRKYYERKNATVEDKLLTRGMRDFHNRYIKEGLLYRVGLAGTGKTLLDVACGVGADLQIWRRARVSFVLGVDYSDDNIRGERDSIYQRYMKSMIQAGGRERIEPMIFVAGDSKKNLVSGEAGTDEQDKNILRAVLGRTRPTGPVPPFVERNGASRLKGGVDCMACMFALHYFFETPEIFRGFMRNVAENLKVGGYFIGACFDGDKVFNLLRDVKKGDIKSGKEKGNILWSITKQYDEDDLVEGDESIGLGVDVEFVTIGSVHREYLVHFPTLVAAMKSIGCELVAPADLKKLKLNASSNTFDVSYDMAKKAGKTFAMVDAVKEFSFLNRWFIFQRKTMAGPLEAETSGLQTMKRLAAEAVEGPVAQLGSEEAKEAEEELEEEEATKERAGRTGAPAGRTVPVAPETGEVAQRATYAVGALFQFFPDAAEKDVLGIGDKTAAQWLSPSAPFPIEDPEDGDTLYPTLEHYLAGMRFRVATNKPELAGTLFGREGTIHQRFLQQRLQESEGGRKPIIAKRDKELLKEESFAVRDAMRPSTFKKYAATFDEAKWATKKDEILREGLRQRWETDARFRKIVEAARDKGKTLLYYAPGANSANLGGVRKNDGHIEGDNKIGKIIMELAGF